jgi:carbamoyl-phosphate synthase large subunit
MVPGAAGANGINTIKALRMSGFKGRILATDSCQLAAGFFIATSHEVMPRVRDEKTYVNKLFDLVKRYKVEVLMPSSGYDIYPYSKYRIQLEEMGAKAVVSDLDSLETCYDRVLTFRALSKEFSSIVPLTTTDPYQIKEFPIFAKPRREKGGHYAAKIDDQNDLNYFISKFKAENEREDIIFQEYLPGTEYTIDVLCDLDKNPLIAVPRIRLETTAGISTRGQVVRNPELEQTCMNIAKHVGIRGPCCIQMKESSEGVMKLTEINPRMGGGTIFAALAGVNFPEMILRMVERKEVTIPKISEITVVRYFEEIIVQDRRQLQHITNDIDTAA